MAGLGAERLAALLLEAAEHDTALLRSRRDVAVASRVDASAVASEIDQQIRSVRRSTAFVDRQGRYAMEQNEIINQYTGCFGEQLLHVKGVSCPLYRKVLYVTMLDCLGRPAFPSVEKHREAL